MVATSLKTDEELTAPGWWPHVPTFRDASPYVRPASPITKPIDVPGERSLPFESGGYAVYAPKPASGQAGIDDVRTADVTVTSAGGTASGARTLKAPHAVATPFPPRNRSHTG